MLNGKKIIFVGNSYTYYGNAVCNVGKEVRAQALRSQDKGYFYQLCKANGMETSVTNWTYGGHTLYDLFWECTRCNGIHHQEDLKDRYFDYVVLQEAGNARAQALTPSAFLMQCDAIIALFRKANPNAQFLFLVHHKAHEQNFSWLSVLPELENRGVRVVDWGSLVWDVINGAAVPGATQSFDKNSFIVCQSETDGFHPNLLTGYLTALMTYCAITGDSPAGQPYSFCRDYGFDDYCRCYYGYNGATTNFPTVFASPADMNGLQLLAERYLLSKR